MPAAILKNPTGVPSLNTRFDLPELDRLLGLLFLNPISDPKSQQQPLNNGVFRPKSIQGTKLNPVSSQQTSKGLIPTRRLEIQEQDHLNPRQTPNIMLFNSKEPHKRLSGDIHNQKLLLSQSQNPRSPSNNYPSQESQFGSQHEFLRGRSQNQSYIQHQKHSPNDQGRSKNKTQPFTLDQAMNQQSQFQDPNHSLSKERLANDQQSYTQQDDQSQEGDGPHLILGKPVIVPTTMIPEDTVVFEDAPPETPAQRQCVQDCPSSSEYRPVCGTNDVTYFNLDKFKCARRCVGGARFMFPYLLRLLATAWLWGISPRDDLYNVKLRQIFLEIEETVG
ncbi:hypothetical protein EVAR_17548_1 [Eumeta japonica]|uniref:Kazal-like domain-containing protein n=1 Tax=Eumeta variegata TaxID=151549 RepID=A0A4C1WSD1_EUMVA|nr:hypothetical protein EVAR_17548_1 [Eumeta japonica]